MISVVVPIYNHEQYIEVCLQSILEQKDCVVELIVIDDGSKDRSFEIAEKLLAAANVEHLHLQRNENQGLIGTLNQALELARGDWFCLVASDDFLSQDSLAVRRRFLSEHPQHVAVFGDASVVDDAGRPDGERALNAKRREIFKADDPIPLFLSGRNLPIHTMMVKTDVLRQVGGFDPRYNLAEDLDVQIQIFLSGAVGCVEDVVYCYRKHASNISKHAKGLIRADKVLCLKKYFDEIEALMPYRALIYRQLKKRYYALGKWIIKNKETSEVERELFLSFDKRLLLDPRLLFQYLVIKTIRS